jgi:hypothetical protein
MLGRKSCAGEGGGQKSSMIVLHNMLMVLQMTIVKILLCLKFDENYFCFTLACGNSIWFPHLEEWLTANMQVIIFL